jgi:ketosteroid isomerase-like protein
MSEKNVATVRAIWDAVNRGDIDEAFRYAPDDFVSDWSSSEAPESGVYRGRDTVKHLLEKTREAWSEMEYFEGTPVSVRLLQSNEEALEAISLLG